jgi:purine-cytosine permease-like protein
MVERQTPRTLKIFGREIPMPASRIGRIILGTILILGGILGFLPILGFWMVPLGVLVLSHDLAFVRRFRRRVQLWWAQRAKAKAEAAKSDQQNAD